MKDPTLITFPPSLDSELARFLVTHYEVPHKENRHTIIISSFFTLWHGFTPLFPLLYSDSYRLSTVHQMVDHFDPLSPPQRQLRLGGDNRAQIDADWQAFNQELALSTAVFAYYHLLPHREIMIRPLTEGAPDWEVSAVKSLYPIFAGLLRVLLRLTADRAREALEQIRGVMNDVDGRLAPGRRFLVADRFSLSDMAFAVAAAPVLLPEQYGGPIPSFAEMPPAMQAAITEMRQHPSGQFALRIYKEHR
jgi:glutathione S-transferase